MDIKCPHCGSYNNIREVVTRCLECGNNFFNSKKENMKTITIRKTAQDTYLVEQKGQLPNVYENIHTLILTETGTSFLPIYEIGDKTLEVTIDIKTKTL